MWFIVDNIKNGFTNFFTFFTWLSDLSIGNYGSFFPAYVFSAISFFFALVLILVCIKAAAALLNAVKGVFLFL